MSCCPAAAAGESSCGGNSSKAYCECGPGWKCEIQKIEGGGETKAYYKCVDSSCVCEEEGKEEAKIVETEGAYCVCGEGYSCKITKTTGPDAGKILCECGNGYSCQVTASGDKVVFKDA